MHTSRLMDRRSMLVMLVPAPSDLPRVREAVDPKSPSGTQNTLVEKTLY